MLLARRHTTLAAPSPMLRNTSAQHLYFALLGERGPEPGLVDELTGSLSRAFLASQIEAAGALDVEFPADLRALPTWLQHRHRQTGLDYRQYLDERQAGAPRRYFSCRSHALHFIRAVAPTKLVDGAWLYGLLPHWQDPRLTPLIRIYLEELGDGIAAQHHVLLYRQLLARYGCDHWEEQSDAHFTQGAIQLALAHHATEFLPEVIGFNLGYEQLPLHLPITAYELNELEVDPYYFTLHVTIDNASTGHARKSLQCVLDGIPRIGDAAEFQRRVANGYRLNFLGMGTSEAIAGFDLESELLAVFNDKATVGALLHSDYCRIGGRTVSDWLASPGQLPHFLAALQSAGWIQRGKDVQCSRFWRLLTDARAPMFGVFDAYEQQLIHDWIVDDGAAASPGRTVNRFRQKPGGAESAAEGGVRPAPLPPGAPVNEVVARHLGDHGGVGGGDGDGSGIRVVREALAGAATKAQALAVLSGLLSPANHPTPAGLAATRLYAELSGV